VRNMVVEGILALTLGIVLGSIANDLAKALGWY